MQISRFGHLRMRGVGGRIRRRDRGGDRRRGETEGEERQGNSPSPSPLPSLSLSLGWSLLWFSPLISVLTSYCLLSRWGDKEGRGLDLHWRGNRKSSCPIIIFFLTHLIWLFFSLILVSLCSLPMASHLVSLFSLSSLHWYPMGQFSPLPPSIRLSLCLSNVPLSPRLSPCHSLRSSVPHPLYLTWRD